MTNLYYTAPSDTVFNEVKEKAMELWKEISSHPNYLKGKISEIKDLKNIGDNFMFIVAQFDTNNQKTLAKKLSNETKMEIRNRMLAGGDVFGIINFINFNY